MRITRKGEKVRVNNLTGQRNATGNMIENSKYENSKGEAQERATTPLGLVLDVRGGDLYVR